MLLFNSDVPLFLVHCPEVYDRPSIYTSGIDEHLRFLVLQRAALDGRGSLPVRFV